MIRCRLKVIMAGREVAKQEPYTYAALAEATGVVKQTLYSLANNTMRRYNADTLDKLCGVLGVELCELLERVPGPQIPD